MKLVIDIETAARDFESLAPSQQDNNLKQTKKDDAIRYLSLYPYTAKVIVIGMHNIKSGKTLVLYEAMQKEEFIVEEKNTKYLGLAEPEMLNFFWEQAKKIDQVITFNGRNFDIPFLMTRSAINKIKPTRNFLKGNKFSGKAHIDLLDKLTYYGSVRKFNLDFYCQALGIESPKGKDITGMDVKELYYAGKIKDIALYCSEDLRATLELYYFWNNYLNV